LTFLVINQLFLFERKSLKEQKSLNAIFEIYTIRSFLYPKEKSCKRSGKTCRFIALSLLAVSQNFLRLPEFDFCSYLAKITRNHGALKRFTDFCGLQIAAH
jgi:hypothetical protein